MHIPVIDMIMINPMNSHKYGIEVSILALPTVPTLRILSRNIVVRI